MKSELGGEPRALLRNGLEAYAQALSTVGGKELGAHMRQGARTAVCTAIYVSPPFDLRVPALRVSHLSVNLTRSRMCGGVDGEQQRRYEALRYSVFSVPAGVPTRWRKESAGRHLNIYFHPSAINGAGDGVVPFWRQQPAFNVQVAGMRQLADRLAEELDNPRMLNVEAADSLARLALVKFARQWRDPAMAASPLAPEVLKGLRAHIVAHLSERILVADLAQQVGLSPSRFSQVFSQQMQQSPHQFVLALRLHRAARLLRRSNLNLTEVARACGFANQQHLCKAMRQVLGTTPSGYRRAHKQGSQ